MTTMRMMTVPKWAASLGLSKQSGYQAVRRCSIPVVDGLVDADLADVLYRQRTRRRATPRRPAAPPADSAGPPGEETAMSYDEARRRREVAEATLAELRLAEQAGTLVLREAINRTLFLAARVMRDQMLAIAPRLAASLGPVTDPKLIELRIADEVRVALRAFAQQLRTGGLPDPFPAQPAPCTEGGSQDC
jgi:hypothetical protein